jgi:hypothetical protein
LALLWCLIVVVVVVVVVVVERIGLALLCDLLFHVVVVYKYLPSM